LVVSGGCFAAAVALLFGWLRRMLRRREGAPRWMLGHPSLWTISLVGPAGVVSCVGSVQLFGLVVE
jgi:hypothetical protein